MSWFRYVPSLVYHTRSITIHHSTRSDTVFRAWTAVWNSMANSRCSTSLMLSLQFSTMHVIASQIGTRKQSVSGAGMVYSAVIMLYKSYAHCALPCLVHTASSSNPPAPRTATVESSAPLTKAQLLWKFYWPAVLAKRSTPTLRRLRTTRALVTLCLGLLRVSLPLQSLHQISLSFLHLKNLLRHLLIFLCL